MKTKLNLCMLLLLGATINGVKAMETQKKAQTKTTTCAKFLYSHPWLSSVATNVIAFAASWRFNKRFHTYANYELNLKEGATALVYLPFVTLPVCATIFKRFGHNRLISSGTLHHKKKIHSICKPGCKEPS